MKAAPRRTARARQSHGPGVKPEFFTEQVLVLDRHVSRSLIEDRQQRGVDSYDEVWDGLYIMPPLANNPHQKLVGLLVPIFHDAVVLPGLGDVYPGANVSDRRGKWEKNFRCPDLVVVLKDSPVIDCGTHLFGGPEFLIEVQSPGDRSEEKVPFYSKINVRELLLIQRDSRDLRLFRHDGTALVEVGPVPLAGQKYLRSEVVPLAFRRVEAEGAPRTEVRRTDGKRGRWVV